VAAGSVMAVGFVNIPGIAMGIDHADLGLSVAPVDTPAPGSDRQRPPGAVSQIACAAAIRNCRDPRDQDVDGGQARIEATSIDFGAAEDWAAVARAQHVRRGGAGVLVRMALLACGPTCP
jgi:hypothetical protein